MGAFRRIEGARVTEVPGIAKRSGHMDRQVLIEKAIRYLNRLPEKKAADALGYIESLCEGKDDALLSKGMTRLAEQSKSLAFLDDEEDIYTVSDLRERYR